MANADMTVSASLTIRYRTVTPRLRELAEDVAVDIMQLIVPAGWSTEDRVITPLTQNADLDHEEHDDDREVPT